MYLYKFTTFRKKTQLFKRFYYLSSLQQLSFYWNAPLGYTSKYYLFDEEGNYVIPIGSIGHGPGQYSSIRSVDTDNKNKTILLEAIPKCFKYNWDGVLIDEKIKMDSAGYYPFQTMYAGKNLYLSTISSPETREYKAFLYEKEETGLKIIRTYLNYFQREKVNLYY